MSWRHTRTYRKWRAGVIRRDKVCQVCDERKGRHAHHINHASYFKEQRYLLENGVCLCATCHSQFHNNFKRNTRMKCDRDDFKNFMDLTTYLRRLKSESV